MRAMMLALWTVAALAGCGSADTVSNNGNHPVASGERRVTSNEAPLPAPGYSTVYGKEPIPEMTQDELFRFRRQVAQMNATSSLPKSEQLKASDLLKMEMYARSKSNNLSQSDAFRLQRQIAQLKATGE